MPSTVTPTWTDNVSVIAATTVANTGTARGTIDLRSKAGAYITIWIGRKGTTAPGASILGLIRRVLNNGTATPGGTSTPVSFSSGTAAINQTTINADASAAATSIVVASGTGFVAGDQICIYDSGFTRLEFARVSRVSGTTLYLDAPILYAHTAAQADNVSRQADFFGPVWIAGGSLVEVVVDYGTTATGSDVVVLAKAQTYDSDSIA